MLISGVIEGFYGRPWTEAQRIEMMDWIAAAGMNLYAYAPKDDVKLRARWREPYTPDEMAALARLAEAAKVRGLTMMAALAPCLDITYSDPAELAHLLRRLDQFISLGLTHFALLFDGHPEHAAAGGCGAVSLLRRRAMPHRQCGLGLSLRQERRAPVLLPDGILRPHGRWRP